MSKAHDESPELRRTLGLPGALAIGVGTMVGAGIFVFPGIAGGEAGPAAILSFLLGGAIAILVALAAAELATAMPRSGGAYLYVSQAMGRFAAMLVGVGLCIGLTFASAFYLVAFGTYVSEMLQASGLRSPVLDPSVVAPTAGLVLGLLAILGTARAARLQRILVVILTIALTTLFLYGALRVTGIVGAAPEARPFAPRGTRPIFTTAALVFTAYLGFVQIVTVAGDVKRPSRTLPRALLGSVLLVMGLYVLVLFVVTQVYPAERLAALGADATSMVAEELVGRTGGLIMLGAGVLATLSSANASILSASRAVLALARDGHAPAGLRAIHPERHTPHRALITVGLLVAATTLIRRMELLAEVASVLHLLMYGLICVSLLILRRRETDAYAPTFRMPAAGWLATLGALGSFGLVAFMTADALLVSGAVVALATVVYGLRKALAMAG